MTAFCLFTEVYFLCLWFMSVKLYSPLMAGIYLTAFTAVCVPVSGIIGPIITRVGSYRWAIWIGWIMNTLALGLLILLDVDTPTFAWVLLFITAGLGQGVLFIAHSIASQAACDQKDAAHAMAMYSFSRSLGLCFGVALGGAIFQNFLRGHDLPIEIAKDWEAYAYFLRGMEDTLMRKKIIEAYAWSFQKLFTTMCGISGVGMIVALTLIKGHTLNRTLESEHILQGDEVDAERHIRMAEEKQQIEDQRRIDEAWFGPVTL